MIRKNGGTDESGVASVSGEIETGRAVKIKAIPDSQAKATGSRRSTTPSTPAALAEACRTWAESLVEGLLKLVGGGSPALRRTSAQKRRRPFRDPVSPVGEDVVGLYRWLYGIACAFESDRKSVPPPPFPTGAILPGDAVRWLGQLADWADGLPYPDLGIQASASSSTVYLDQNAPRRIRRETADTRLTPAALEGCRSWSIDDPGVGTPLPAPNQEPFVFARSGDGYFIRAFGVEGHFKRKGLIGLCTIEKLLRSPGLGVPMTELDNGDGDGSERSRTGREEVDETFGISFASGRSLSKQPAIDVQARTEIKSEIDRLSREVDEATREGNETDRKDSQEKLDKLEEHYRRDLGLGGKSRDLGSYYDKVRPKLAKRHRAVYVALRTADPSLAKLADHLEVSVRCESPYYIYQPESPPIWAFELGTR